jgi:hypothetical protein
MLRKLSRKIFRLSAYGDVYRECEFCDGELRGDCVFCYGGRLVGKDEVCGSCGSRVSGRFCLGCGRDFGVES